MSIVDEINKDLAELGEAGGETIEEAMDKLGDEIVKTKGEADANKLPEVTAEDEGNVLMVGSDGKWGKGEAANNAIKFITASGSNSRMPLPTDTFDELKDLVTTKVVEIYDTRLKQNFVFNCLEGSNGNIIFISNFVLTISPFELLVYVLKFSPNAQDGILYSYQLKTAQ